MTTSKMLCSVFLPLSFVLLVAVSADVPNFHDYCVVGAGPGGLQSAYFLDRSGRDYIVFEKENVAGAFYVKYPRHRRMISINKRHTGKTNKEFNLRHDWNSLLSDDESLLMKHYSKDFFPTADSVVKYMNDYAQKLKLKIQYNTYIKHVTRKKKPAGFKHPLFNLRDQNGTEYNCYYVIMSTGIWVENIPHQFKGIEYTEKYSEISTNPDDYEGQSVLIVGRGNSAFEIASSIMGATNLIHMISRSRVRLSWETHYVGDLRAVNNGLLDTYQLKSLDALLEAPVEEMSVNKRDDRLWVDVEESATTQSEDDTVQTNTPDNFAIREPYDRVILCLGFKFDFSIFDNSTLPRAAAGKRAKKYPAITHSFQSTTIPRLYFAGTNTHSLDLRKSAGGFIHGFRYTARALHHILEQKHHGVTWPHTRLPITELLNFIIKRVNEGSGFYQMFSVLGDVIIFRENGELEYFEEFPVKLVHRFERYTGRPSGPMIVVNMEYGKNFSGAGKDNFRPDRATGEPFDAHNSNFLHPVLYFYANPPTGLERGSLPRPDRLHHVVEDFLTLWDGATSHILPLRRFLEYVTDSDLREFFAQSCFKMLMTHATVPRTCQQHYLDGPMLPGTDALLDIARAGTLMSSQ